MLWPFRSLFRLISLLKLIVISVLAGMGIAFFIQLREMQRTWGILPDDAGRRLPGDDLIDVPDIVDTRSLVIDAGPSHVWPWLVQLGYGRGGWYSYDRIDMAGSSTDTILEEFQELAVGDIVPTHPGGGFVVKELEPERALVLYLDTELVKSQAEAAASERLEDAGIDEATPAGLQAAGSMGDFTMPDFRATWAFLLESEADGRTRLIERYRVWTGEAGMPQRLGMPLMGLGVFAMTRKHMLGIQERAEALARGAAAEPAEAEAEPAEAEAEPAED